MLKWWLLTVFFLSYFSMAQSNPELQNLSIEFWEWKICMESMPN
jgi:hypothetical protein